MANASGNDYGMQLLEFYEMFLKDRPTPYIFENDPVAFGTGVVNTDASQVLKLEASGLKGTWEARPIDANVSRIIAYDDSLIVDFERQENFYGMRNLAREMNFHVRPLTFPQNFADLYMWNPDDVKSQSNEKYAVISDRRMQVFPDIGRSPVPALKFLNEYFNGSKQ